MAQLSLPTLCLQATPSLLGTALRAAGHGAVASEPIRGLPIFLTQQVSSPPSSPAQTNQSDGWPLLIMMVSRWG